MHEGCVSLWFRLKCEPEELKWFQKASNEDIEKALGGRFFRQVLP